MKKILLTFAVGVAIVPDLLFADPRLIVLSQVNVITMDPAQPAINGALNDT
jgi:hypothetical protein